MATEESVGDSKHFPTLSPEQKKNDELSVEDILEKIGGFSVFQIWATVVLILPEAPSAMLSMLPILTGADNLEFECLGTSGARLSLSKDNLCSTLPLCKSQLFRNQTHVTSIVQEWNLFCERSWIVEMLTSVQMAGCMVGGLLFPWLADKFGRRKVMFTICLLMGTSGTGTSFSPNVLTFGALKFLCGLGVGGVYVVYLNYLMEFLTPAYRTICGCVSVWAVGEVLLAGAGYVFPAWRHLSLATGFPALFLLFAFPWLPESPRWLLCKGRTQESLAVFNHIATWNGKAHVTLEEVASLRKSISKDEERFSREKWGVVGGGFYQRQSLFAFSWFFMSLVYFGLSFNANNLGGDARRNVLFLGFSELPGTFSGLLLNNRLGRKRTLVIFLSTSAACLTLLSIVESLPLQYVNALTEEKTLATVLALLGRYCNAAAWAIMACFTAESFPTVERGTAVGICGFAKGIGGIFAPQVVLLGTFWRCGPYLFFCILSILVAIICLTLKETMGEPLSDELVTPHKNLPKECHHVVS